MTKIALYRISKCLDSVIAIDNRSAMFHIHGKWIVQRPVSVDERDVYVFADTADKMGMFVVRAESVLPPVMIFNDGAN